MSNALPVDLDGLPDSIPACLAARAQWPDDAFLIGADFRLTFGEADRRSAELARRLMGAGIGKGTRTALLFPNTADWVVTWLAAARIGALTVPLSTFAPGAELARALRHADVHALLTADRFGGESFIGRLENGLPELVASTPALSLPGAPYLRWIHTVGCSTPWSRSLPDALAAEIMERAQAEVWPADDLAVITTSGATAAPKAVVHTQGSLVRHAGLLARRRGLTASDRIYSPLPFFWVGGLTMVVLAALTSGCAAVVQERFEPGEALTLIERERVTQISCWPNAARAIADHPSFAGRDLTAVRGGTLLEALPADRRPAAPDLAPNLLGMTETGGPHTAPDDPYAPLPEALRGTFGRSLAGFEHRVVDDDGSPSETGAQGELHVRGPLVMAGLYKRERHQVFTPDGWYPTGDLGWFGGDGHLRFAGRRTSMIKTGGSNVSPAEVEHALLDMPDVSAAYVFGVPAGDRGEDVAAVVVSEPGRQVEPDELRAALRKTLASYKVPRRVHVVDEHELPMLPTGKADLLVLRARFDRNDHDHRDDQEGTP